MAEKHLLAVNLTDNKKNDYLDDTPFTSGRLSPATREAKEAGSKDFTKIVLKSMKLPQLLAGYLLVGIGLIVLLAFIKALPDTDFSTALQNGKWFLVGGAASAAVGGGLLIYCHLERKKREASEDVPDEMSEPLNSLEAVSRRVAMELNLPEDDQTVMLDALLYRYKAASDGGTKEVLESGCFENSEIALWREGDTLCLTDYDCVLRIPVSAVEGYYTVDAKYKISFWWKDEEFNKGEYAQYGIKEDSEGNYRLHTYYRVVIREGEDRYEIRVPAYDFDKFQEIVGAACLDGEV